MNRTERIEIETKTVGERSDMFVVAERRRATE